MRFLSQFYLILIVFSIALFKHLSISHGLEILKPITIVLYVFAIYWSITIINKYSNFVNWKRVKPMLVIFLIYPFIRLVIDVILVNSFVFKHLTDAFYVRFQYYVLFLIGLSQAIIIVNKDNFFKGFIKAYWIIFASLLGLFITLFNYTSFGDVYFLLENLLVPFSFLVFHKTKNYRRIGYINLAIGIILVSVLASRSYLLVFIYILAFLGYIKLYKEKDKFKKTGRALFIFLILLVLFNSPLLTNLQETPLYEKINIESLYESLSGEQSLIEEDYKGDSRSRIIKDAFHNFNIGNIIFGKGIFGQYKSFVERNTIEIGWLQQAFWFGFVFVLFQIYFYFRSMKLNLKQKKEHLFVFGIIISVKFLDSFIYGMPNMSLYNLFVAIGMFTPFIKRIYVN
ncbi:hypothetical protein ACFSSB_13190 [Lacinutrix gracilariae]|uniref:Uncharacterized protein n=1 Tax=Lacinutrix gracilariae TaxID=1747198 RepID=A0ABW5K6P3_9FLAO